ncbi:superoxide dismutase [Cu-Zn] SodC [Pseudomonas sp. F1_0610]|uniref:superoxide dismutase [Cu-Zn] SodC n=1 Tax=Pseudomonas sp. F1_0610 TaxID=3114284 RepID=UPI0039C41BDE
MKLKALCLISLFAMGNAYAAETTVSINEALATGAGQSLGSITISETEFGLLFTPNLKGLPANGVHGFHIHANGSCDPDEKEGKAVAALKAGGHFDPENTGVHLGPFDSKGHLGDLPSLVVNQQGVANYPVLAPRLKSIEQLKGKAIMVHAGGDNFSDQPEALGGGGARMACGVIQ